MKLNINFSRLAIEFVVVFFGVAVALAADSWREGLLDQSKELDYLRRLHSEIESGQPRIEEIHQKVISAIDSISELIILSEQPTNLEETQIIHLMLSSTAYEYAAAGISFDSTYQELLSSGSLNLIENSKLLDELGRYSFLTSLNSDVVGEATISGFREWANSFREAAGISSSNLTRNGRDLELGASRLGTESIDRILLLYERIPSGSDKLRLTMSRLIDLEVWLSRLSQAACNLLVTLEIELD